MTRAAGLIPPFIVLLFASLVFLTGITWGLPSRQTDRYLFGLRQPWTGEQILALTQPTRNTSRGADLDADPINRSQPVLINATDPDRAQIVQRYRLYSYQPDEMNTLMALAAMRPGQGDFDPRMYKYGGLWVYPVGALLQASARLGLIELRNDRAFYLDHPEAFARFYLVARAYAVMWALVCVGAVYALALRLGCGRPAAFVAAALVAVMPVVVTQAHEAKPHLPGVALVLLATLAAGTCARTGKMRHWALTGLLCGAAVGMVLTTWAVFALLPMLAWLNAGTARTRVTRLIANTLLGALTYCVTNPYVPINLVRNRDLLGHHFRNTAAFYEDLSWLAGIGNGLLLWLEAASPMILLTGLIALALFVKTRKRAREKVTLSLLLLVPAAITLVQFLWFAGGQPPDYARFALLPSVGLVLAATTMIDRIRKGSSRAFLWLALLIPTIVHASLYLRGFVRDANGPTTRNLAAALLPVRAPGDVLTLHTEPAPFSIPPLDLWNWQIILQPRSDTAAAARTSSIELRLTHNPYRSRWWSDPSHALIGSGPLALLTRISHADKSFEWVEHPAPPAQP